jgi:hypothetical protein
MAKPSDLDHGLAYAGATCVVTLVPVLVLAPLALRRVPAAAALVLAGVGARPRDRRRGGRLDGLRAAHGPRRPVARVGCDAARATRARRRDGRARDPGDRRGVHFARGGLEGRGVGADRAALVAAARPLLADVQRVASLDVGWVSAATEADIVDLAGVTDPVIAALPGGHTSKRVDATILLERRPDALLLYAPRGLPVGLGSWRDAVYTRALEARLASDDVVARHFEPVAWLPLGSRGAGYVLLRSTVIDE